MADMGAGTKNALADQHVISYNAPDVKPTGGMLVRTLLRGGTVHLRKSVRQADIILKDDKIESVGEIRNARGFDSVRDLKGLHVFPGFVDVHVHLREPGFFYKESIRTGTLAAARGGFTSIFAMPNVHPTPDCTAHLKEQLRIIKQDAVVRVYPYGAITRGQKGCGDLSDMVSLSRYVKWLSDDGNGIQNTQTMREAMKLSKRAGCLIAAHCEDKDLRPSRGIIHEGRYSAAHHLDGIPSRSEYEQLKRDIDLVRETGCRYHMCHVSAGESVSLLRKAKQEGLDITAETAPHYLILCEDSLQDDGAYKMNPPLRAREDRAALIAGLLDGTIDMVATDHAPHTEAEKGCGLSESLFGIVGLETCFQLMMTYFVKPGLISLEKLTEKMIYAPADRFGIKSEIVPGHPADMTVWDINRETIVQPDCFASKGRSTPFRDTKVFGYCIMTLCKGKIVYEV